MKRLRFYLLSVLFIISNTHTQSQVTIGSGLKPSIGAILDLKEKHNFDGGANATKGLLLPRVSLASEYNLYPMYSHDTIHYEANKADIDEKHIGLLVYNTNDLRRTILVPTSNCDPIKMEEVGKLSPGLVVWDGTKWYNLTSQELESTNKEIFDNVFLMRDHEGNEYTYSKFGDAGYWMTSSLITKTAPPNVHSPMTYFLWDSRKSQDENTNKAFYGYPRKNKSEDIRLDDDFLDNKNVGLLYSRGAIYAGQPIREGMQGICPEGWHIPSRKEYDALLMEIKNNMTLYTSMDNDAEATTSQLLTTDCVSFGSVVNAVSKPAHKGGFSFIMSGWADCERGVVNNGEVFELASVSGNRATLIAGAFTVEKYLDLSSMEWKFSQMVTIRCKKD